MLQKKATPAGTAIVDKPKRKRVLLPAPAEPPVPALGLSDEQIRYLSEVVASRIESRITAPSADSTPSMVFTPKRITTLQTKLTLSKQRYAFHFILNVEHLL